MAAKSPESSFSWLVRTQFGLIRKVHCYLYWKERSENLNGFFGMLQDFATYPPAREIKNIYLKVEPARGIRRSTRGVRGEPVYFSVLGYLVSKSSFSPWVSPNERPPKSMGRSNNAMTPVKHVV